MNVTQSTSHQTTARVIKGIATATCTCGWSRTDTGSKARGHAVYMAEAHERAMADPITSAQQEAAQLAEDIHASKRAAQLVERQAALRDPSRIAAALTIPVAAPVAPVQDYSAVDPALAAILAEVGPSKPSQPCQWVACQAAATTTRVLGGTSWHVCRTHSK